MNKNDLASQVAAETSATRATAERMIGAVFAAIGDALARDEPVAIAGFGTFFTRTRALRRGRNPQTGERLDTPPRRCRYSRPRRSCEIPSAAVDETRHRGVRARRSARGTVPVATVPAAATPRLRQARQLAPRWTSPSHPRFPSSIPCRLGSLRIVWGRHDHRWTKEVAIAAMQYFIQSTGSRATRPLQLRPPCANIPPDYARLRSGLSPGAFRSLTAPHRLDGRIVGIGTRASRRWSIQGKVRRLRLPIPEQGRQVASVLQRGIGARCA